MEPEVIYEDKDFLAVDKPSGMLTHATRANADHMRTEAESETLVDWLAQRYPEIKKVGDDPKIRPGIVHRLDKDTSGVILVAKTQAYFEYLKKLFQDHEIKKTYVAWVYGVPKEKKGIIDKPIALKSGTTKRTVFGGKMMKEALTEYELISSKEYLAFKESKKESREKTETISFLKVWPKTGRTHQIRVHLASIGCPVLNDVIYARKKEKIGSGRLMLHALSVEFVSKEGKKVLVESGLPEEFSF